MAWPHNIPPCPTHTYQQDKCAYSVLKEEEKKLLTFFEEFDPRLIITLFLAQFYPSLHDLVCTASCFLRNETLTLDRSVCHVFEALHHQARSSAFLTLSNTVSAAAAAPLPNLAVPWLALEVPHAPGFRAWIPDLIDYDLAD